MGCIFNDFFLLGPIIETKEPYNFTCLAVQFKLPLKRLRCKNNCSTVDALIWKHYRTNFWNWAKIRVMIFWAIFMFEYLMGLKIEQKGRLLEIIHICKSIFDRSKCVLWSESVHISQFLSWYFVTRKLANIKNTRAEIYRE